MDNITPRTLGSDRHHPIVISDDIDDQSIFTSELGDDNMLLDFTFDDVVNNQVEDQEKEGENNKSDIVVKSRQEERRLRSNPKIYYLRHAKKRDYTIKKNSVRKVN